MTTVHRPVKLIEPPVDKVEAFVSIYDETAARVYGVVLRVVRDPAQAEEVTQEVYLEIWRQVARFDPARGSAVAWLMTIAHGKAVDRVRSVEASRRRDLVNCALSHGAGAHDETSETAERLHNARVVRAALSSLSVKQRQAIELAYFDGHSHSTIARLLDIPLGTAKGRIRDGLIQLRHSIDAEEAESRVRCG